MIKLYNRIDGCLHFHEAWVNEGSVFEYWGVVGERGKLVEHPLHGENELAAVNDVVRPAADAGFRPVDRDDLATLLIEFSVDGFGTVDDLTKRHSLEDRMNDMLGWTGLGHCDGGSTGSGTMEVCCLVIDFDIAKRVIEADLRNTPYSNFTRIYQEC